MTKAKITSILLDARTEWSVRWTTLTLICYAFLFYLPRTKNTASSWIDWTLPIQLVQGGNLGFYNLGWHYYFGLAATLGLVMGGCLASIIFPLLQRDNIVGGYLVLMALLTVMVAPCAAYLGVLSNLMGLTLLVIVIFVENIYVPVLDLRLVLPDVTSIWKEVIRGSAVAALVYVGLSWAVFAIPPWHSGSTQALRLASAAAKGIADTLRAAANEIEQYEGESGTKTAASSNELKGKMRELGSALFQGTNYAGLSVPIGLYGSMGSYELSALYPLTSLDLSTVEAMSSRLDEAAYHCSVVLSVLGHTKSLDCCLGGDDLSTELRSALSAHLEASANLAEASSVLMQVERRENMDSKNNASSGRREKIYLDERLWEWSGSATGIGDALEAYEQSKQECTGAVEVLRQKIDSCSVLKEYATLLWAAARDTTYGSRPLAHFMDEFSNEGKLGGKDESKNTGTLGRLGLAAMDLQDSWNDKLAFIRQVRRSLMFELVLQLVEAWRRGFREVIRYIHLLSADSGLRCRSPPRPTSLKGLGRKGKKRTHKEDDEYQNLLQRRGFRRAVQWTVGTWGLYAMATWWEDFRAMFGSTSTGPWTMVAFYVCFRPSVEETINTAVLRSFGHGLGALVAWLVNANVSSRGLLMVIHGLITFVLTWMIPTPFTFPSGFSFPFDAALGTGLFEGLLTTYHLTSSVVLSANPASAAKARSISQCIGSAAAAIVSATIFPWWAEPRAKMALRKFHKIVKNIFGVRLQKDELHKSKGDIAASVNELLTCQRELNSVSESKWLGGILRSLGLLHASETTDLQQQLLLLLAELRLSLPWGIWQKRG